MNAQQKHIHFVGIGGIGMSAIATILRKQDFIISGCDSNVEQESVYLLQQLGCNIYCGNNTTECNDNTIETLVYSSIIPHNHPELIQARKLGIPVIPRGLMLAELMHTKKSIAIAGSHGKTTTTSLLAHIFIHAKKDPTVLIGGHLSSIANNAYHGNSDILIAEADESDKSLLYLKATNALITNIDFEHPETYNNIDDVISVFKQFINNLPFYGTVFINCDDRNAQQLCQLTYRKIITFSIDCINADIRATNIILNSDHSLFTITTNKTMFSCRLPIPGKYNIYNALGAIAVALYYKIHPSSIIDALKIFGNVKRRFYFHGTWHDAEIFDDYGHHPKEISCVLEAARNRTKNKLIVVFQPHKFSRTNHLWNEFVLTLKHKNIDQLIITDIYPAGETPIKDITSKKLVNAINKTKINHKTLYAQSNDEIIKILNKCAKRDDLVLFLGAGPVYHLAHKLTDCTM
jgi:UDP-N-acetylmuramate--alanine ligase